MEVEPEQPAYEFTGPDDDGFIRLKMPNVDPHHAKDAFIVSIGCDKEAIAEAMCQWLGSIDYGECS